MPVPGQASPCHCQGHTSVHVTVGELMNGKDQETVRNDVTDSVSCV